MALTIPELVAMRLEGRMSCLGCKFLYRKDEGYSNYTVENTEVRCALNRNPSLPAEEPYDWTLDLNSPGTVDNWAATNRGRCIRYDEGTLFTADVDGDSTPGNSLVDPEQIAAITAHMESVK